jgi:hypothetical protein
MMRCNYELFFGVRQVDRYVEEAACEHLKCVGGNSDYVQVKIHWISGVKLIGVSVSSVPNSHKTSNLKSPKRTEDFFTSSTRFTIYALRSNHELLRDHRSLLENVQSAMTCRAPTFRAEGPLVENKLCEVRNPRTEIDWSTLETV